MKLVYLKKETDPAHTIEEEIKKLEGVIRDHPTNEKAYDRLMILYRKQGNYKQELRTINRAIKTFEELFRKKQPVYNKKIKALSSAISKLSGLADKKGNSVYEKGELARWRKRKAIVAKKIK